MKNRAYVTVKQVTTYLKQLFDQDPNLNQVLIKGEISNLKIHSSGHIYFTLKDGDATLKAVMFRSSAAQLKFVPADGMNVYVFGRVSMYEVSGQIQMYAEAMEPDGLGALHLAYEQLKAKLEAEGLFAQDYKKALPFLPKRVGVVTSPTGAAVRDILHVLQRRFPALHVIIIPVSVQGDAAPAEIAGGIELANRYADIDVLIVGRGGGSIEELWAFNTEVVARAIFTSRIPIVSAVGHETDFTIADFVADHRAPTPSAAAEIVVPELLALQATLNSYQARLRQGLLNRLQAAQARYIRCVQSPWLQRPKDSLVIYRQRVEQAVRNLSVVMDKQVASKDSHLREVIAGLQALSPLATLERGYSIATHRGRALVAVNQCQVGDEITVKLRQGSLQCEVTGIKEEE